MVEIAQELQNERGTRGGVQSNGDPQKKAGHVDHHGSKQCSMDWGKDGTEEKGLG